MTFEQAKPLVEAKLLTWGAFKFRMMPTAPVSSTYLLNSEIHGSEMESQQERYVVGHEIELAITSEVDRALEKLDANQQEILRLRYGLEMTWDDIAQRMHMSRRAAFTLKDKLICVLAYIFGLLDKNL